MRNTLNISAKSLHRLQFYHFAKLGNHNWHAAQFGFLGEYVGWVEQWLVREVERAVMHRYGHFCSHIACGGKCIVR